ncbi:response regulator transcription factor [Burkholderia territorii]|uniref:Response regulator transcription factor n=1 Tax=Burkholderia territorii TaxID=1503055 RepID=A0A6L3NMV9_9BURK|nr:response regulator transcription factor [Burkholderia territorii]KAB0686166.1 response regulator transcription factor [Burkholderia territorii]MBM2773274.1 response regulator transcription factor [Burkholderia territorii]VWB57957.1 DNA-binding response regulator [Burkholderia territorii]
MKKFAIRVVIADDHPAVLFGLQQILETVDTFRLVGVCQNSTELIATLRRTPCDVVLSDYTMPPGEYGDGLALFGYLQRHFPDVGLVVFTMMSNPVVIRSLIAQGVSSVLSKADPIGHIITAIHASYASGKYTSPSISALLANAQLAAPGPMHDLSPREAEVLRLLVSGQSVANIARHLRRSKQTVSTQKRSVMRKFGAATDMELIKFALEATDQRK